MGWRISIRSDHVPPQFALDFGPSLGPSSESKSFTLHNTPLPHFSLIIRARGAGLSLFFSLHHALSQSTFRRLRIWGLGVQVPPGAPIILIKRFLFGFLAVVDVIRAQRYTIALSNQKIVVKLTQLNWRDESIRWQGHDEEMVLSQSRRCTRNTRPRRTF
jgi:hypothetical protein